MIKVNELRVGNRFIRELRTSRGMEFDHDFILTEEWMGKLLGNDLSIALEDLHPIPLIPEVFEKAGFYIEKEVTEHFPQFNLTTTTIHYSDWDWIEETGGFDVMITTNTKDLNVAINTKYKAPVNHLHTLQNLYFFNIGKELEIKL